MAVVDHLVDATAGHKFLSFMDGYSGYNQIFIAEEDTNKTTFRCPRYIVLFEWIVMAFGLKNAGATYQRTMNVIFHDLIGRFMEVYIDDVVVKSHTFDEHIDHLKQVLLRMRHYQLKMNATKCAFGVTARNFLGFLVHKKGIEIDKDKAKSIIEAQPPTNKQELQQFLGQVNFLRRFISNLSGKTLAFSPLLRLKSQKDFKWKEEHQKAFEFLKLSLTKPPVLMPPIYGKPLKLYILANHESIGSLLAQDNENGHEQAIYYLSRRLNELKGQALADFLVDHPNMLMERDEFEVHMVEIRPWKLSFDGSKTDKGVEAGVVFMSPKGELLQFSFQLDENRIVSNNQAEYEALIIVTGEYKCYHPLLELQLQKVKILMSYFDDIQLHIFRLENGDANQMAQIAYGIRIPEGQNEKLIRVQKRFLPFSIERDRDDLDVMEITLFDDWRIPIKRFLENPNEKTDRNIKQRTINYIILGDDLFRKSSDEVLLLCIAKPQTMTVMGEVHEGICGSHQSGEKMKCNMDQFRGFQPFPYNQLLNHGLFRGWAIDMIAEIIPHSSLQHEYVMVATDYFTKWTEAIPLKKCSSRTEVMAYASSFGVKILNSSPYYAQANAQVESTNKIIKNTLSKMITNNPREWHDLFPKVLWAYKMSKRDSTKATPYELVYGQAAVLPVEINVASHRIARHYDPCNFDFEEAMYRELDGLEESIIDALSNIQA
ncbi:uncharacterized protein LOC131317365 [Rhododendron vialii]|uniref:uncharacterized protein LOC131317365 n=1 Tax=Rhododendron vialii TaxID=182163 RepID=UPI00265EE127|nr:uncharacterized protein LOC131317365 [Rhododendron vialii]